MNADPVFADAAVTVDVDENETAVYQASASDANSDTLTYTLGGTDAAAFNIAADGTVTFKTAPDYEVDPTSYSFTVTADDGNGGTAIQTVTVNVNDVAENADPVFADAAVTVDVDENQTAVYQAVATDANVGSTNGYHETVVKHLNIAAETASEIKLSIENTGADQITVTIESTNAADPVDLVTIGAMDHPAGLSAPSVSNGVASIDLIWPAGQMPETTSFQILWSKESNAGNWMLEKSHVGTIDTSFEYVPPTP